MPSSQETETLYSPSYAAEQLGVSPAQVRRWAAALESITGVPIKQHPRTGRAYSQSQLATLLEAKKIASAASGMSAETALSIALGKTGYSVPLKGSARPPELSAEMLAGALAEALAQAQKPLLTELQKLTAQLGRLEAQGSELGQAQALPEARREPQSTAELGQGQKPGPGQAGEAERRAGAFVRAAEAFERMLDRWLRR